jgi:hypothetical protein
MLPCYVLQLGGMQRHVFGRERKEDLNRRRVDAIAACAEVNSALRRGPGGHSNLKEKRQQIRHGANVYDKQRSDIQATKSAPASV